MEARRWLQTDGWHRDTSTKKPGPHLVPHLLTDRNTDLRNDEMKIQPFEYCKSLYEGQTSVLIVLACHLADCEGGIWKIDTGGVGNSRSSWKRTSPSPIHSKYGSRLKGSESQ